MIKTVYVCDHCGIEIGAPRQLVSKHTRPPKKRKKYENEFNSDEPAIMRSAELI